MDDGHQVRILAKKVDKREDMVPAVELDMGEYGTAGVGEELVTCEGEAFQCLQTAIGVVDDPLDDFPRKMMSRGIHVRLKPGGGGEDSKYIREDEGEEAASK